MIETAKLGLPLVQEAQAQKHVTVNEALLRVDSLVMLSLETVGGTLAPAAPSEGEIHAVGAGALGAWSGHDGELALFSNGGWLFIPPRQGWRGWRVDTGVQATYDGVEWVEGGGALTANGAGFVHRSTEVDHVVGVGGASNVVAFIPAGATVYGVTGRVIDTIGGATSIEVGIPGSTNRYGSGIGTAAGSWLRGMTSSPLAYYSSEDLVLSAVGGSFDGTGVIRLAIHYAELTIPRA